MQDSKVIRRYYEIHLHFGFVMGKEIGHSLFYRTDNKLSDAEVVKEAVKEGWLLDIHAEKIDWMLQITKEEYEEFMWDD